MKLPLSVLDLSPIVSGSSASQALRNTLELGQLADRLGYARYWLAEHHNMPAIASSAPEIMIGQVARETSRIRVGSGGIMLPNHAPLRVAEAFRTLEALFPGRIDLGIGRAPGSDQVSALALRGGNRRALLAEDFPQQLADLFGFSEGNLPADHPYRSVAAVPTDVPLPPVWLLGSSDYSARLAARLGLGFAFAAHFSPHDAEAAMLIYRQEFRPSRYLAAPRSMIAASVICGETAQQADYLAASQDLFWVRFVTGRIEPFPSPEEALAYPYTPVERAQAAARRAQHIIGDPVQVKEGLIALAKRTEADEVMIVAQIHSHAARLRSYELVAEAFGLPNFPLT
ncbi:MAG TPA: LLM class flavin-dependent oxidoreductase [Symbiobacteriaceae bacterium]|nr:LLM class flavin-dependent oxidoreductase [Symbiobacteriaceae bacterium]